MEYHLKPRDFYKEIDKNNSKVTNNSNMKPMEKIKEKKLLRKVLINHLREDHFLSVFVLGRANTKVKNIYINTNSLQKFYSRENKFIKATSQTITHEVMHILFIEQGEREVNRK